MGGQVGHLKTMSLDSQLKSYVMQEHFYLETQAALVVPREDEFEVYSSSQNPRELQECVAEITGVPFHRVLARIKRMGGGFGG